MRREFGRLRGEHLVLEVPETKEELNRGYRDHVPGDGEGMLFVIAAFVRQAPIWVPIIVGVDAPALDVLWIHNGHVDTIVTHGGGTVQGFGDMVLELPCGWAQAHGVRPGDRFELVIGGEGDRGS